MRFALRKQHKIRKVLGDDTLNCLLKSLKKHFEINDIELLDDDKTKYKTILIDNIEGTNKIEFYVIKIQYDVYQLSFKEINN